MKVDGKLAKGIEGGGFLLTAEYLPQTSADGSAVKAVGGLLNGKFAAVNAAVFNEMDRFQREARAETDS